MSLNKDFPQESVDAQTRTENLTLRRQQIPSLHA